LLVGPATFARDNATLNINVYNTNNNYYYWNSQSIRDFQVLQGSVETLSR